MSNPQKIPVTIVLPSLNPDEKLTAVLYELREAGFDDILLVNDGSDSAHLTYFPSEDDENCELLTHEVNRGKGAALKTAFRRFLQSRSESIGVVTVDGDHQHRAEDVRRCAEAMFEDPRFVILGVRDFSKQGTPFRSRAGNLLTSLVFRVFCGLRISDTQTGLRAIPRSYLPDLAGVEGDRFEYETNMLLEMKKRNIPYREIPIETVYIEGNSSSHFHAVRDSFKIYRLIFKFLFSQK